MTLQAIMTDFRPRSRAGADNLAGRTSASDAALVVALPTGVGLKAILFVMRLRGALAGRGR